MRLVALILMVPTLLLLQACPPKPLRMPQEELLNSARITKLLEANTTARPRVSGHFKARAVGLKRLFGTIELTFALQQPSSFYLSVPSFFGQPARVVTSDGEHNYILDMSETEPFYLVEPKDAGSLQRWIGLQIEPREFVHGLLGILDLDQGMITDTRLNRSRGIYALKICYKDGRELIAEFDLDNDRLLSQNMYRGDDKIYSVTYSDYRDGPGGLFAWHIDISAKGSHGSVKMTLDGEDLNFPAEAYDVDTFQIEEP